jgi:hypothetical protein
MTRLVRIDPHAHLYESFSVREWCESALRNLRGGEGDSTAVVVVVDRDGQDSLARLRAEVPSFGAWRDMWDGKAGLATLGASSLLVIQGVQYVANERIEVLGLGVERVVPDRLAASEYVARIGELGGLACLPWSPGKWFGHRGELVRRILDATPPTVLTVGDISLRARLAPRSPIVTYARSKGFSVLSGTDPLPRSQDEGLVGSLGCEVRIETQQDPSQISWEDLKLALLSPAHIREWGRRNSPLVALTRFVSSIT